MVVVQWCKVDEFSRSQILKRPVIGKDKNIIQQVQLIIDTVREQGDEALFRYTEQFDGVQLKAMSTRCKDKETVDNNSLVAIQSAIQTIHDYHLALKPAPVCVSTAKGINLTKIYQPIERVGLYVPGGETPLVSSLLMLAVPARIAGNPIRVICTPPLADGDVHPLLKASARLCGIETIYTVGGAQAIAAMAYGTETIPKVDKIFGPGNRYVTTAKGLVAFDPDGATIDMPAGPSEVMILADADANADFVAADLLAQAEHGPDSQVILVSTSEMLIKSVLDAIERQKQMLTRVDIIDESLKISQMILVDSEESMLEIANRYAAEHLIINTQNAENMVKQIYSAGTIFIGPWAAESLGDYVTGSNHVLPTYGYAKSMSGLATNDFMKAISIQRIEKSAIQGIGQKAKYLAQAEGLTAHENAITIREKFLCL